MSPTKRDVITTGAAAAALSAASLAGVPDAQGQVPPPYSVQPKRERNKNNPAIQRLLAYRPTAKTFGPAALEYAAMAVGHGEVGRDNSGPITDLLCNTPPEVEEPWCACFTSSCWFWASYGLQVPTPFIVWYAGADGGIEPYKYVPDLVAFAKRGHRFVNGIGDVRRVTPGAMLFVRGGSVGWSHVGLVTRLEGGNVYTVEGNIGASSSKNGRDMVKEISRPISSCDYGVI